MGVSAAHFGASLVGCEHPIDPSAAGIALSFPGVDFFDEQFWVVDSAVQALAAQNADLDLNHVEPAGVLGGVVEFEALQNAPGFGGRKGLVEGASRVSGQVVLHN